MSEYIIIGEKNARLEFAGCEEDYIRDVCHGRCCVVTPFGESKPKTTVFVTAPELVKIEEHTGMSETDDTYEGNDSSKIKIKSTEAGLCKFQEDGTGFCQLHPIGIKPSACFVRPWKPSPTGARLIIENRYKMMCCYQDGARMPAYRAFRSALVAIFGEDVVVKLTKHFDDGGGDYPVKLTDDSKKVLNFTKNEWARKKQVKSGGFF